MDTSSEPSGTKPAKRSWRRHSDEFRARVILQARQAHASVASVALANGLNANMLRRWVREFESVGEGRSRQVAGVVRVGTPAFIALPPPPTLAVEQAILVEVRRGDTSVSVTLPVGLDSAAWVREVLG